ncbi:MAG: hypothetical protein KDA73_01575 [Rhodobacteraceae bacterium]|nr:hypothetical protein [Paracoccaceae bacterium]
MSNIAGKAYAMNVVTPSKPYLTWANRLLFMVARGLPKTLSGLLGLSLIHFARWVIIRRDEWPDLGQGKQVLANDYMLFCSNFNGTWDQYIDAFSDGIPNGLNLFWYTATKYPQSIPVTTFKNYITYNQVMTDYYYNATPGSAQRDVKCAMRVYRAVEALAAAHGAQTPEEFAKTYLAQMSSVQGCLGDPGFGPVASLDTERADINRRNAVRNLAQIYDYERDGED